MANHARELEKPPTPELCVGPMGQLERLSHPCKEQSSRQRQTTAQRETNRNKIAQLATKQNNNPKQNIKSLLWAQDHITRPSPSC